MLRSSAPRLAAASLLAAAGVIALLPPGPAEAARILPPGGEDAFGRAEIDLNRTGRVAVAYERVVRGPDVIHVAIRRASRLNAPTAGRRIGRGALRLVRLADAPGHPHLVAWRRRGETVASVWRGGSWRTERLPPAARRLEPLAGAVVGRRALLVLGGSSAATVVTRGAGGGWRARALPAGDRPRSRLVAVASEGTGRVVAAWTEGAGAGTRSIAAATFSPAGGRWTSPRTVLNPGAVTAARVGELEVNARGDAVLSAVTDPGHFGPSGTPAAAFLARDAGAWGLLPPLAPAGAAEPPQLAVTATGVPVRAWREGVEIRFARLAVGGASWAPHEVAWRRPDDDFGFLDAVDDLAVDEGGRVVIAAGVDPGPGPDYHYFLVRPAAGGRFGAPSFFGSVYGRPRLIAGGRHVAASWVEDLSTGGLPEGVLAR